MSGFAIEETGEKSLFVGWPFVEGKLLNEQLIRCPLIFFPVELVLEDKTWYLRKSIGELPFYKPFLPSGLQPGNSEDLLTKKWLELSMEDFSKSPWGFEQNLVSLPEKSG